MVQIEVNNTNQEIKAGTIGYVLEQNNSLEKQLVFLHLQLLVRQYYHKYILWKMEKQ